MTTFFLTEVCPICCIVRQVSMPLGSLYFVLSEHVRGYFTRTPLMGTSGAVASRYLICHLACVSSDSGLRRFWTHSGVCVRLWPSSDPHELGFAAASSSPEIHGGVQHSAEWASPRCDSKRPAELCLTDRPGCRHSVPDHSHCSACKWKRKSHVCEGMHQRGYIFSLMVLYL